MAFWDGIGGSLVGGLFGLASQGGGTYLNMKMQKDAQRFEHEEAELGRDWQEEMLGKTMKYNSAEAALSAGRSSTEAARNRTFQMKMRQNQYQTAMADMKAAGLNPMLAFSQGGAGNVSGSVGQSHPASVSGGGSAPTGRGHTVNLNSVGEAAATAIQVARGVQEVKNLAAENRLIDAQTYEVKTRGDANTASAQERTQNVENLKKEISVKQAQVDELMTRSSHNQAAAGEATSRSDLNRANKLLAEAHAEVASRQGDLYKAQELYYKAEALLLGYKVPEAKAHAGAWSTEYGQTVRPFLDDMAKLGSSAAQVIGASKLGRFTKFFWERGKK